MHYQTAAGSITGTDHIFVGKNNQDGYCVIPGQDREGNPTYVGVVCDGCGSGGASEIGSKIGANLIAKTISRELTRSGKYQNFYPTVRGMVLNELQTLRTMFSTKPEDIDDWMLFTVVGFAIYDRFIDVFSIGDGYHAVDGKIEKLGPFPGNAPPYIAYDLLRQSSTNPDPDRFQFKTRVFDNTRGLTVMVGTDGVEDLIDNENELIPGKKDPIGPLEQFWTEDRYFKNSDMIRRKLSLINRNHQKIDFDNRTTFKESGYLKDDTTLIVARPQNDPPSTN